MENHQVSKFPAASFWFLVFVCVHFAAWTLAPSLLRDNLPMDAIEGAIWGHQLEWGYDKNPFMNGWLTALAVYLDGYRGWMLYCFSQLSVAACLGFVWLLARKMAGPMYALVAVLLLETLQYFNLHAIDFNDNTLELSLWAGAIYFFYDAVHTRRTCDWLLTGIFLGLGMMTKYYTLALIAAFGLYLLRKENRGVLFTLPPYLGLAVIAAIMLPHLVWLTQHDYVTVTYVFARAEGKPSWVNHFYFPAQFIWQQLQVTVPALVVFALLFLGKRPRVESTEFAASDKRFLFYAGLGPFLLTAILSLLLGIKLRAGWGVPLQSFWPLLLILLLPPRLSSRKIYVFIAGIFLFMAAMLTVYSVNILDAPDTASANFPGREVAAAITERWHQQYHTPVSYVAGSRWVGGNIAFYSGEHPAVFMDWNLTRSPWINVDEMKKKGAVFVWSITGREALPKAVKRAYPRLNKSEVMMFEWHRNKHDLEPMKVGVAFLAPEN